MKVAVSSLTSPIQLAIGTRLIELIEELKGNGFLSDSPNARELEQVFSHRNTPLGLPPSPLMPAQPSIAMIGSKEAVKFN